MKQIKRLSLGQYEGSIDYPDGCRLEELDVRVDADGNLEVKWLELPGKPSIIKRARKGAYKVAFEDGTLMRLRAQPT
jgi:hypothetical protein